MQRGSNVSEKEVPRETVEHISGAGCKGQAQAQAQAQVVTLAHKKAFRD